MRTRRVVVVVGLALAGLSACGTSDPADTNPMGLSLDGRTFVGSTVTVDGEPHHLVSGSVLRLSFDRSTIGASGGCNTMGGDASWDAEVLELRGPLATTEMACEQDLMDQDSWFADVLDSEPSLDQGAETLTLTAGGTVIVLTDEDVVVPDQSLTSTKWTLDAIATGSTVSSVPARTHASVTFGDDGMLAAFLGCNQANGAFTATANRLTIDPLATTKRACTPPESEVEDAMLQTLNGSVDYSIDGATLVLTPQSGDKPYELTFVGDGVSATG